MTEPRDAAVLVVDGANVVGSRPDGWWRDRAGAARRLHGRLVSAGTPERVVLVLEGAARKGAPEGEEGGVRTVHATASGDDRVVAEVERLRDGSCSVVVVTADRGLRGRVVEAGAQVQAPSWLLDRLPRGG